MAKSRKPIRFFILCASVLLIAFAGYKLLFSGPPAYEPKIMAGYKAADACPNQIDPTSFATRETLHALMSEFVSFGSLRAPGGETHDAALNWLEAQLNDIEGLSVTSQSYGLKKWIPSGQAVSGPGRSLETSASLTIAGLQVNIAGAVPMAKPTESGGVTGALVYLPRSEPITAAHAGKIIVRDFPNKETDFMVAPPFMLLAAINALYMTSDLYDRLLTRYDRAYLAEKGLHSDLIDAGQNAVAGLIFAFDVPSSQMAGYWDPHQGVHYDVPAIFIGVDEALALREASKTGIAATISLQADVAPAQTRNIIATLPGMSSEKIAFIANTDGNTWVQENGVVGMLALARYFAGLPLECRPRALEFVLTSAHLQVARDGAILYSQDMDAKVQQGDFAFGLVMEHLGTREILPVERADGLPGRQLVFSGEAENLAWVAPETHYPFRNAVRAAIDSRSLQATTIMNGVGLSSDTVEGFCNFGGIGSILHQHHIPTMALISGPWSLWAPSFGEDAIDFARMRKQLLAIGDVVLSLDHLALEELHGPYTQWREDRAAGRATCKVTEFGKAQVKGMTR